MADVAENFANEYFKQNPQKEEIDIQE